MEKGIIIVGAGPSGLMAALKLAEAGYHVTVVEVKQNMETISRACSMQFIMDDDYEADVLTVAGDGKLRFEKCGLEVPYTGKLVPVYNKYYHSPRDHIIRFTRDDGKTPFSYKFEKQVLLKGLYEQCERVGVTFRMGTLVLGGKDLGDHVELQVKQQGRKETLSCAKLIIAEGVNAIVSGKFGLNADRPLITTAYSMKYIMEGITGIEDFSWNLYYGAAYRSHAAAIIGPSLEGEGIYEVTITGSKDQMPQQIFEGFTESSPMAANFANAKTLKKVGCSVKAFMPMKQPCKGNVMAIGDSAAMIEVEVQGGLLCGYMAAKALADEMDGKNGFAAYTKWWMDSFEFNSSDYLRVSQGYALTFAYTDDELDYLFSLVEGHPLHGTYSQYLTPKLIWEGIHLHDDRIQAERPEIYAKMKKLGAGLSGTLGYFRTPHCSIPVLAEPNG